MLDRIPPWPNTKPKLSHRGDRHLELAIKGRVTKPKTRDVTFDGRPRDSHQQSEPDSEGEGEAYSPQDCPAPFDSRGGRFVLGVREALSHKSIPAAWLYCADGSEPGWAIPVSHRRVGPVSPGWATALSAAVETGRIFAPTATAFIRTDGKRRFAKDDMAVERVVFGGCTPPRLDAGRTGPGRPHQCRSRVSSVLRKQEGGEFVGCARSSPVRGGSSRSSRSQCSAWRSVPRGSPVPRRGPPACDPPRPERR